MRRGVLSGYKWFGDLPPNWEERKIQYSGVVYSGGTPDRNNPTYWNEGQVPWLTSGEINKGIIHSADHTITELALRESSARWAKRGSVLIALNGQGKTKGSVALLETDSTINQSLCCIKPDKDHYYRFIYYYLSGRYAQIRGLVGEDREGLNQTLIKSIVLPLPNFQLQTQIASFLDQETSRIDALISKKERQIELLQEKRQAIITHAVTKGLNPTAKMKDSGVEWIGQIPEEWQIRKLSWIVSAKKGKSAQMLTKEYVAENEGEFPVYSGQTENGGILGRINWNEYDFTEPVVLATTVGAKAMSTQLISGKFSLSQNCLILAKKPEYKTVNISYLEYSLQVLFEFEKRSISLIMQPSFRIDDLYEFRIPLPSEKEQENIASALKAIDDHADKSIAMLSRSISLLQEYRSSLITAAVSGQIDVSEIRARAPE